METLKKTNDFNELYNKGEKKYTKYTIIITKNTNKQYFGFVTSKKVGNAVKRNRLRRLFREVVYKNSQFFDKKKSFVIIAKKQCLENYENLNYEIIKKDILKGIKNDKKYTGKNY